MMPSEGALGNGSKAPTIHRSEEGNGHRFMSAGEAASVFEPSGRVQSWQSYEGPDFVRPGARVNNRAPGLVQSAEAQIDFMKLEDGSLVELVEDQSNPNRTRLAVFRDGHVSYQDGLEHEGRILTPLPRSEGILKYIRLPYGAKPYKSIPALLLGVGEHLCRCATLADGYLLCVLSHFVLNTWLSDRLPMAPYLSVVGLPQSGKTTLLRALNLICRRPLLVADMTPAAVYDAYARLTPTLLIDEGGTPGNDRALRQLMRMGSNPDLVAIRRNRVFSPYGAKVICWREPPTDPALRSRCIEISMTEADNTNFTEPTDPGLEESAADLRARLLQFRFEKYNNVKIRDISETERLRPRSRDLLKCLAAFYGENEKVDPWLIAFFKMREIFGKEPLPPSENAVLTALFFYIHEKDYSGLVYVGEITKKVNYVLERAGERLRLQPRKVGAVLRTFGLSEPRRTNAGWSLVLDRAAQARIHQLVKSHGQDYYVRLEHSLGTLLKDCPLCREWETCR